MSVSPAYEAARSQGYDLAQKGFELAFAPTPEAPDHSFRPRLFFVPLAKSRPMTECSREPLSPRSIWCLAPILGVFVKGGRVKKTAPGGHRLVSKKEKLQGNS